MVLAGREDVQTDVVGETGVGHAPQLETPKVFAELLTRFIVDLG
ncbi:hypothetical protein ACFC09_36915 [Streptomyces sp. NPDC056161]